MSDPAKLKAAYEKFKKSNYWTSTGKINKGYGVNNQGEAAQLDAYVAAIVAGGNPPFPPDLATLFGDGLGEIIAAGFEHVVTPPPSTYIWHDEFDGPALSAPDPTKWWATPWCSTSPNEQYHCYTPGNAYLDGNSNLVMKVSIGTRGRPYDSARIQTFQEGQWPPAKVLASFAAPCRIEARVKFAPGAGLWGAVWANTNSGQADNFELDAQEFRGKYPTIVAAHTHHWVSGVDQPWGANLDTHVDLFADFHRYWTEYRADSVRFGYDDTLVGEKAIACKYPIMPRLSREVGVPGTWGGDGGPPPQANIPALMLVDYVRVSVL